MDELSDTPSVKINITLRKQLCNVSDKDCILIEFSNREEEEEYAIGYTAWLKRQANDEIDVNILIQSGKQVLMYWPIDLSVQPAKSISKHLAKAKFMEETVVLKSSGNWIDMKQQLKCLRTTGRLEVSRKSRKALMKKQVESPIKPKLKKDKFLSSAKDHAASDQNHDILNKQAQVTQRQPPIWNNMEDDIENDGEYSATETYDSGLAHSVDSTIPTPTKLSRRRVQVYNDNEHENEFCDPSKRDKQKPAKSKKIIIHSSPSASPSPPSKRKHPQISNKTSKESETDTYSGYVSPTEYAAFEKNVPKSKRSSAIDPKMPDNTGGSNFALPPGVKRAPPLPDSVIKMCLSKKKLQSFVSGLIDNFFEKSYLAEHSPTGQTPNIFVTMNIVPKPALHPPIVQYIRELVTTYFGSQVGIQGKVTKAISDKIANARPKKKGQATATATVNE